MPGGAQRLGATLQAGCGRPQHWAVAEMLANAVGETGNAVSVSSLGLVKGSGFRPAATSTFIPCDACLFGRARSSAL